MSEIQGVVMVLVDEVGHEIASSSVFDQSTTAGFTRKQSQELLAKKVLAEKMMRAYCSPIFSSVVDEWQAQDLMRLLCRDRNHKIISIYVGYDEEKSI